MDLEWSTVVAFGLSSGLVAGSANQGIDWLRERYRLKHQAAETRALQADQRLHEARLRAEAAHASAADYHGQLAADVADWIEYMWGKEHGMDVDYVSVNRNSPSLAEPADVIAAMRCIERRHPTKVVRKAAGRLASGIDAEYGG